MSTFSLRVKTLRHLVEGRALATPDQLAFRFYRFGGAKRGSSTQLSYQQLWQRVRVVGAQLAHRLEPGERALVVCPPGLDYIIAFLACQLAGVIAVPAYPPRNSKYMERLEEILKDADARCVLCLQDQLDRLKPWELADYALACLAVDQSDLRDWEDWQPVNCSPDAISYLQYTSGTTGLPKGVMATHRQILENLCHIQELVCGGYEGDDETEEAMCSWLPPFHDLGLIGTILLPLYLGCPAHLMAPASFVQRPLRWLEVISQTRSTLTMAPNFAYQLCCDDILPEQRAGLDLSNLRFVLVGAEPVQLSTLEAFTHAYAAHGFQASAFCPAYGMAENVLVATGRQPWKEENSTCKERSGHIHSYPGTVFDQAGNVQLGERAVVSCGQVLNTQQLVIVDPQTSAKLPEGTVGEIWLSGPSTASGYWRKPELTQQVFEAQVYGETSGQTWLRTGDLGALREGELYVLGRVKEMVIVRGQNYYAVDLEVTANGSDPLLGNDRTIAFGVEQSGGEELVFVHELSRSSMKRFNPEVLGEAIGRAVRQDYEIEVSTVVFIRPASLPRASSGKLQHLKSRSQYVSGMLSEVARWEGATGLCVVQEAPVVRRFAGWPGDIAVPSTAQMEECLSAVPACAQARALWCVQGEELFLQVGVVLAQLGPVSDQVQVDDLCCEVAQVLQQNNPQVSQFLECSLITAEELAQWNGGGTRNDTAAAAGTSPQGRLEELVADCFELVLHRSPIYRETNFFQCGGNSLQVIRLTGRLQDKSGYEVPRQLIYEAPRVWQIASAMKACKPCTTVRIMPADPSQPIPLSFQQESLWFFSRLDERASVAYNEVFAFDIHGLLEPLALEVALQNLTARHSILRTTFVKGVGEIPCQQIATDMDTNCLKVEETRELNSQEVADHVRSLRQCPFDLARGPLFRATLLRFSSHSHILVIGGHHSVVDGWSLGIL